MRLRLVIALAAVLLLAAAAVLFARSRRRAPKEKEASTVSADAAAEYAAEGTTSASAGSSLDRTGDGAAAGQVAVPAGAAAAGAAVENADAADPAQVQASEQEQALPEEPVQSELEKGRAYLQTLDERTPVEVQALIDEARAAYEEKKKRAIHEAAREKYREKLAGDQVWSYFDDYIFLGDSRVEGFDVFHFLPSGRILADPGDTITSITNRLEEIQAISPKRIFISYGINDVTVGLWSSPEDYVNDFSERIDELQQALPEAEIFINSILPVSEQAAAAMPSWGLLPSYSEAVRQMCEKKKITFIDNDSLAEEHSDLYAMDGVHVAPDFYHYWAENQILGVYDREHGY